MHFPPYLQESLSDEMVRKLIIQNEKNENQFPKETKQNNLGGPIQYWKIQHHSKVTEQVQLASPFQQEECVPKKSLAFSIQVRNRFFEFHHVSLSFSKLQKKLVLPLFLLARGKNLFACDETGHILCFQKASTEIFSLFYFHNA